MTLLRPAALLLIALFVLVLTGCATQSGQPTADITVTQPPSATVRAPGTEPSPITTATGPATVMATGRSATPVPSPQPSPSIAPTFTATPISFVASASIGVSIGGRDLHHTRFGFGATQLVLLGALHGGHECNTRDMLLAIQERLRAEPELVPATLTIHILPALNPDGCLLDTRENARGVDLNRNWDTPDWSPDAEGPFGYLPGSGGDVPFSETETYYLRNWLLALREANPEAPIIVISYHSAFPPTGLVLPGYHLSGETDAVAAELAQFYSEQAGYRYDTTWLGNYHITGEMVYWLTLNGFVGLDVELPDREEAEWIPAGFTRSHIDNNWQALLAVLAWLAEPLPL